MGGMGDGGGEGADLCISTTFWVITVATEAMADGSGGCWGGRREKRRARFPTSLAPFRGPLADNGESALHLGVN